METCKVTYIWTKDELLRCLRHHQRSQLRPSIVMAVNVMAILLASLSVFVFFVDNSDSSASNGARIFVAFAIYWFFLRRLMSEWWWTRSFDKSPGANAVMEWEFSEQQIAYECAEVISFKAEWKVLSKIAEANDGFLLYTFPKNTFYWLPFAGFESPEGIEKFRSIVQSKQVQYGKITGR